MDKVAPAVVAGFRALVVDDEAALADVVASYLKRESFEQASPTTAIALSRWHVRSIPMSSSSISDCPASTASRCADNFAFSPTHMSSC
jgi:hypothetical protein